MTVTPTEETKKIIQSSFFRILDISSTWDTFSYCDDALTEEKLQTLARSVILEEMSK